MEGKGSVQVVPVLRDVVAHHESLADACWAVNLRVARRGMYVCTWRSHTGESNAQARLLVRPIDVETPHVVLPRIRGGRRSQGSRKRAPAAQAGSEAGSGQLSRVGGAALSPEEAADQRLCHDIRPLDEALFPSLTSLLGRRLLLPGLAPLDVVSRPGRIARSGAARFNLEVLLLVVICVASALCLSLSLGDGGGRTKRTPVEAREIRCHVARC